MTDKDAKQVEDIALLYVRSFNRMNLQAYTIGDRDLVLGISKLKQLQKKAKFPLLSVNILDDKDQPVFQPSTVLNSGGIKIGIIGATTALLVNRQKVESEHKLNVEKPVLAIRREVAKLKKQGVGLFILLSHLNQTEITEVGRLVPEIQIVLGGQDMRMEHTLKRVGSALVGNGYMKGKYLSIMDLMVQNQS